MVHFDATLIEAYLREFARVLKPGGKALIHHSNYSANEPPVPFQRNPHWRNHMSAELFHAMALQANLTVLEQKVIDWHDAPSLDCVSILQRPEAQR
jgi:ubiquinone/menaquinone biosynthesis C-methylase UbiE